MNLKTVKNLITNIVSYKYFFPIIAFILPFIFYFGVFFGRSFGLECATGVMGFSHPYQQTVTNPNHYCGYISDIGAYAWQHYPHWVKVARDYMQFKFPIWNQNSGIGAPLAANFISSAYFIPNIIFAAFNSVFAFDLYFIFRMAIASLGMYLFLRTFKLPKTLCLIGSMIIFLNGYVTHIPTISHHNVDILLPWIGFLINKSIETKNIKYFVFLGAATALSHLGGMPESSVFVALFFVTYSFFISFFIEEKKKILLFLWFMGSFLLSFLLSAILILPGAEYLRNALTPHLLGMPQPFYTSFKNVLFWPLPRLLGSTLGSAAYQAKLNFGIFNLNYIGTFSSLFLSASPFLILFRLKHLKSERYFKYYIFFIVFLLVLLSQYFGLVQNPLFTKLPGFSQTNFPKYSLTLINLLISAVVVFTIYFLIKYSCRLCLIPPILTLGLFEAVLFLKLRPIALSLGITKYEVLVLQLGFSAFIVAITTILIWHEKFFRNRLTILYLLLLLIAAIELFLYLPHVGDMRRRDSLRKPPFIDYLKARDYKEARTFSPDYILYPNLSAVFDINDVRNLEPVWPKNYFNYLNEFVVTDLNKSKGWRFTGIREQGATTDAKFTQNVFFDLLSVKYILSYNDVNAYEDMQGLSPYLKQISETPSLKSDVFNIQGISRPVLFEQTPGSVKLNVSKPEGAEYLYLYPALSEKVFNDPAKGDGVKFIARATNGAQVLFEQEMTINPKVNKNDQKWFEMKLGPFSNDIKQFSLTLETNPLETSLYDWAGWGGLEWDTQKNIPKVYQYKKIYDNEIKIYENTKFIPRLHPISETVCAKDENDVLKKMHSLGDQIRGEGVVLEDNCKNQKYEPGKVVLENEKFDDQKVSFTYTSTNESYVILSNDFYPGWKAKVNGKQIPIEEVNYAFQGLKLPKAKNAKVEVYYDPDSFKLGLSFTILSLIGSIFLLWKYGNRKVTTK
jgi:hypothetical protein